MSVAQRVTRAAGDDSIGLNVFGFNDLARGMYERTGFQIADRTYTVTLP